MRHKKYRHRLNRFTSYRDATLKSIARNILIHQSIRTTLNRALASRTLVEELISLGKEGTLSAKRDAFSILNDHKLVSLLCSQIAPRFAERNGGYTRIIRLGQRRGDSAQLVVFELTEIKKKEVKKPKKKAKAQAQEEPEQEITEDKPVAEKAAEEKKQKPQEQPKPPHEKKPSKKFLGGLRKIFKKERDSL